MVRGAGPFFQKKVKFGGQGFSATKGTGPAFQKKRRMFWLDFLPTRGTDPSFQEKVDYKTICLP